MRKAAFLMEKGIDFSRIIEDSFNKKTFAQNRVLGYVLMKAELAFGGQCIVSSLTTEEMDRCGVTRQDIAAQSNDVNIRQEAVRMGLISSKGVSVHYLEAPKDAVITLAGTSGVTALASIWGN
jgi:nanoRNase/pAp phosphatase (c-di-AMP/oligoRNAs hydrolase)